MIRGAKGKYHLEFIALPLFSLHAPPAFGTPLPETSREELGLGVHLLNRLQVALGADCGYCGLLGRRAELLDRRS